MSVDQPLDSSERVDPGLDPDYVVAPFLEDLEALPEALTYTWLRGIFRSSGLNFRSTMIDLVFPVGPA